MAATMTFFNSHKVRQYNGNAVNWATDEIWVSFHTSSYTPNIDTHDFFDDVTAEASGGTYVAGGYRLTTPTDTLDTANDRAVMDADDVSLTGATIPTCRYAVLRKKLSTPALSPLIAYIDFGADQGVTGGTFAIQFNAVGVFVQA